MLKKIMSAMELKNVPSRSSFPSWPDAARWLLLVEFAALFVSTSLTSVVEILLFLAVIVCLVRHRELRARAVAQPMVIMGLVLAAVIILGAFYGGATLAEKLASLKSWRKLLLLPIAALLLTEPLWKQRLLWTLIGAAALGLLFSYAGFFGIYGSAIAVHNHATQGIFFAAGAFAAAVAALHPAFSLRPLYRWLLGAGVGLWVINIIFITPGRGGYLALLVLAVVAALTLLRGWRRLALTVALPLLILALLGQSPVANQRLTGAVNDMQDYRQADRLTEMGIRMVMWRNTLRLIQERPLFGHGTGGLRSAYQRQVEGVEGWRGSVVDDPHNQFLKITAEHGLLGLLVFMGLIGSFFCQKVPAPYRILGLGILLALVATSLFSGHFTSWSEGRFLMIWVGGQLAMLKHLQAVSEA